LQPRQTKLKRPQGTHNRQAKETHRHADVEHDLRVGVEIRRVVQVLVRERVVGEKQVARHGRAVLKHKRVQRVGSGGREVVLQQQRVLR
jgi:hypothetical protein